MLLASILLRIPVWLVLAVLWLLWLPFGFIASPIALLLSLLSMPFVVLAAAGEAYALLPSFILLAGNRVLAKNPIGRPPAFPGLPRRAYRPKAQPVPVVQGLTKTSDAPTVNEAIGRLPPHLRAILADQPQEGML